MNIEELREYCIAKKGSTEEFPFDEVTLVFKVMGKMFALTPLDEEIPSVNIKCEPEMAIDLRERYPAVEPGFHMAKSHWNTVILDGSIKDELIKKWIDISYNLVVAKLTKKQKEELNKL